ncbi:gamma-aminobutyraldehyde dehydrogenase [Frondihabitans sp. PAMC 28766]|uniref:aminobutyraldehyde dehydrogenase n=1 Tax=Frondihabitans sp. PAMC 28766 TaxID=1795630 RepID=UPI00078DA978|nr:aminobutyraldehyde dehydrogenase [Frondihabitans sp. PAMC 28766]AMM22096.1 gamma-aminobutyraldehyde dehydrogenase [Frondihabitans sp. PAMC 28766]
MPVDTLQNFIDGAFVEVSGDGRLDVVDPRTEQVVAISPISDASDVDRAMAAAAAAFPAWKRATPSFRQKALLALADALEAGSDRLVEAQHRNTGQPKATIASEEVAVGADQIRFFAGAARHLDGLSSGEYAEGLTSSVRREPIGVVAQVTPWNYPLMMALWKIGPALAAGNTIVLKPSDTTPESTLVLAELTRGILPDGVFNVVLGDASTGSLLTEHPTPGLVAITGSVRAGRAVAMSGAGGLKRVHLELGGKAPVVVFPDVDIEATAQAITEAGFFNAGQDCTAATRVIVHRSIHDRFVEALVAAAEGTVTGDTDEAFYGPLNNARHFAAVSAAIEALPEHATIRTGGFRVGDTGFYFAPTIVADVRQDDAIVQDEVFGPVLTVQPFDTADEALELANGVRYALASSVWTDSHTTAERFARDLDFGCVWINTHIPLVAEMPHGGFKQSGYGKDLSAYSIDDYTRVKHVMSAH